MARYTLSTDEQDVLTTWLVEPAGYLDQAVNAAGVSARQALAATPTLDVAQWIRANSKHPNTLQSDWDECAMVWWVRASHNVNVNPNQIPAEAAAWRGVLQAWAASIDSAFVRASIAERDAVPPGIAIRDAQGVVVRSMGSGTQLARQKSLITKVRGVIG